MAGRQGAARRRRLDPSCGLSAIQVVVHDLAQAEAVRDFARELGLELIARSAPGAAGYAGVGWLKALADLADVPLLVDCGDDAGLVMAGLREGLRDLAFSGPVEVAGKLADMADALDARLRHERESPARLIELDPYDDARRRLRLLLDAPSRSQQAAPGPTEGDDP